MWEEKGSEKKGSKRLELSWKKLNREKEIKREREREREREKKSETAKAIEIRKDCLIETKQIEEDKERNGGK